MKKVFVIIGLFGSLYSQAGQVHRLALGGILSLENGDVVTCVKPEPVTCKLSVSGLFPIVGTAQSQEDAMQIAHLNCRLQTQGRIFKDYSNREYNPCINSLTGGAAKSSCK